MTARMRIALALLWLALLAVGAWWIGAQLQLTGDLRKFMPARHKKWRAASPDAARAADAGRTALVLNRSDSWAWR